MHWLVWLPVLVVGVGLIVWGAEAFAEKLGQAATRLGIGGFALALLLSGAEPEELATVVTASIRHAPGIGLGDVIGANVAMCLVALGLGAAIETLAFSSRVFLYSLAVMFILKRGSRAKEVPIGLYLHGTSKIQVSSRQAAHWHGRIGDSVPLGRFGEYLSSSFRALAPTRRVGSPSPGQKIRATDLR